MAYNAKAPEPLAYSRRSSTKDDVGVDTCMLLKLRKVFADASANEMELLGLSIREKLLPLREKYLSTTSREAAVSVFFDTWKYFSTIDPSHTLYIPPIYGENGMLDELISRLVEAAWLRETDADTQAACPAGHFVISGLEGTGKTTILKAFAIGVAVLSSHWFLVYVDYRQLQATQTPRQLAAELYVRIKRECFTGKFGCAQTHPGSAVVAAGIADVADGDVNQAVWALSHDTNWFNAHIGIACDEIQQQIVPNAGEASLHVQLMRQLHDFARSTVGSLLIFSGSTADLRSRLFSSCRRDEYTLYTSFKGSLCNFYHMCALRTCEELKSYIECRYPHDGARDIAKLLHLTGGIGQHVHSCIQDTTLATTTYDPHTEFTNLESGLAVVASLIRRHQAATDADKTLEKFIIAVSTGHHDACLDPAATSIRYSILEEELKHYTIRPVKDMLEDLVDRGLIYMPSVNPRAYEYVQLAVPAHAAVYYVNQPSADDMLRLQLVWLMVNRPGFKVHAGYPLEDLVRPRIHTKFGWQQCAGTLRLPAAGAYTAFTIQLNDVAAPVAIKNETLLKLHGRFLQWEKEAGLDGVHFAVRKVTVVNECATMTKPAEVTTWEITLDGWQCNGGAKTSAYGGGEIATHRGDNKLVRGGESEVPEGIKTTDADKHLGAVAHNAELGFMRVASALLQNLAQYPDQRYIIKIGKLWVTTTKKLAPAGIEWVSKHERIYLPVHSVERRLLLAATEYCNHIYTEDIPGSDDDASHGDTVPTIPYSCEVLSGTQWFATCLEEELKQMWPH